MLLAILLIAAALSFVFLGYNLGESHAERIAREEWWADRERARQNTAD